MLLKKCLCKIFHEEENKQQVLHGQPQNATFISPLQKDTQVLT